MRCRSSGIPEVDTDSNYIESPTHSEWKCLCGSCLCGFRRCGEPACVPRMGWLGGSIPVAPLDLSGNCAGWQRRLCQGSGELGSKSTVQPGHWTAAFSELRKVAAIRTRDGRDSTDQIWREHVPSYSYRHRRRRRSQASFQELFLAVAVRLRAYPPFKPD